MAADIIEIIGAPGIGKTTLYNSLCKKWNSSCNWTHQDAVLTHIPAFSQLSKWIEYQLRRLLRKKTSGSIPSDYGVRFARSHPELAKFCWARLSNQDVYTNDEPELRFRSAYHLYLDFCRYQAITEAKSHVPCIISEGFLQKSFMIEGDLRAMPDLLNEYLPLVPLPKAVIFVNSENKAVILNRLGSRDKVLASHQGKSEDELMENITRWQYQLQLIVSWMSNHGVKVYSIDGARPLNENVKFLTQVFKSQNRRQISVDLKNRPELTMIQTT